MRTWKPYEGTDVLRRDDDLISRISMATWNYETVKGSSPRALYISLHRARVHPIRESVYVPWRRLYSALPALYERAVHLRRRFTAMQPCHLARIYTWASSLLSMDAYTYYIHPHTYGYIVYSEYRVHTYRVHRYICCSQGRSSFQARGKQTRWRVRRTTAMENKVKLIRV